MTAFLSSIVCCYVGCAAGAPDMEALNVLECDTETGAIAIVQTVKGYSGTTYFQIDRGRKRLCTVFREKAAGGKSSCLAAFPIGDGGRLGEARVLAKLPCEPPCHVALSPDGTLAAFAAYSSASVGVVPADGGAARTHVLSGKGTGGFPGRQDKAYAHFAFFTPDGSRVGFIDLGCDRIRFFDPVTMRHDETMCVRTDRGDGPRHAVWSRDGRYLFVLDELSNSVTSFASAGGVFRRVGKWSTLPAGFKGTTKAAAIKLTADGKILMASNRGFDSIAFFAVDTENGTLDRRNVAKLGGSFPRDFELMPGEKFMIVGHKRSNEIQAYRFDRDKFDIHPAGRPVKAWMPLCFKF